jgi:protein-S-isoprenylcysteine O-methyltransferase Ste14
MTANKKLITPKLIVQLLIVIVLIPLIPMLISGVWNWWETWVYALLHILGFVASRVLAARRHPDIIAERAASMEMKDAKSWDRSLAPLMALGPVLVLIVIGFDKQQDWTTPFAFNVKIATLVVMVVGYAFSTWAFMENRFFSGVVRIQKDRGHHVVSTGPYRIMRHPGYAGAIWMYLATPIFMDSLWAFIPTILLVVVTVIRTSLEDRTLQEELPGYKEFTQKTRYRLFPGIW